MPAAFERCVKEVGKKKGVKSAYAICTASDAGGIKEYRKHEAMHRKMDQKPANKRNK